METVMMWGGVLIILGAVVLLVKQVETRLVLFCAGLLMCTLAGNPMAAFAAFEKSMTTGMLIKTICSVMGFAFVMKATKCDAHLIHILAKRLVKLRLILIPAATLVTAFVNISLPSAAGVSAAVGAIIIPLLINMGVRPAMAAAAVFGGTYGSMFSPGWPHNPYVAKLVADATGNPPDVMAVINNHYVTVAITLVISAVCLGILGQILKENKGWEPDAENKIPELAKPNLIFALVPIFPVLLLMFSSYISGAAAPEWGKTLIATMPSLKGISVPAAMLLGCILGIALTRTNPINCSKEFFKGMGHGYADVVGIIICAGVLVGGMQALGIVQALIDVLKHSDAYAVYAAALGPFFLAIITGSGDAATLAFNEAITPHAEQFGSTIIDMGALASIAGSLGRTMSPLAGAAIICAGLANVNTMELSKRTALGMLIGIVVSLIMIG